MLKDHIYLYPTTSGTGSEVTSFAVITDSETHIKYPLADYALTPDIAIVDPALVMSVPASVTADTGMDVLTHAIESYVSVMASDYTRGLHFKRLNLFLKILNILTVLVMKNHVKKCIMRQQWLVWPLPMPSLVLVTH